ncbi:deaminase [Amycolatopsis cynarae]|uniref:Deaminase n=1 Tax=Amycolatopsis cynarae TaxID=2995223 RepID=A0ABY7B579_9PSEU|nr:deaminase [Amycolatopsis sp. HUAS 11-8]WAL67107.1 deaminase [Amycolatopsis sp. HUAS 11-8]
MTSKPATWAEFFAWFTEATTHLPRPTWDEYGLILAHAAATRSDCERSQVGAVVMQDHRTRASGYNGSPAGAPGCESCPRRLSGVDPCSSYDSGPGACVAVHAEANALLHSDRADLPGATLFVTREPCPGCGRLIAGSGVARVVTPADLPERTDVTTPLTFARFIETNEWEGETWNFWLQTTGNEEELARLRDYLARHGEQTEDAEFQLADDVLTESEVDLLVRYSDGGYTSSHSKVTGPMRFPEGFDHNAAPDAQIYKGRIRHFFPATEEA